MNHERFKGIHFNMYNFIYWPVYRIHLPSYRWLLHFEQPVHERIQFLSRRISYLPTGKVKGIQTTKMFSRSCERSLWWLVPKTYWPANYWPNRCAQIRTCSTRLLKRALILRLASVTTRKSLPDMRTFLFVLLFWRTFTHMQNALLETEYILFLKNALANTTNAPMDSRQNWYLLRRILFASLVFILT